MSGQTCLSPVKAALVRNYLEVYWPRAGGLSAVNAIDTQLRDPINSGLTRWRMDAAAELGRNLVVSKHQIQLEYVDEQTDAGRNCRTCLARSILRRELGQENIPFPCSADHEQDWQPNPVDTYSCYICDHNIHIYRTSTRAGVFVLFLLCHVSLAQPPR